MNTPAETPMELQTATRAADGQPCVRFTVGAASVLLTPDEARYLGNLFVDFAGLAETEAAIVRVLRAGDSDVDAAQDFVALVTEQRAKIRQATVN